MDRHQPIRVRSAPILLVDDERANLDFLRRILEPGGYRELHDTTDPYRALEMFDELGPDLVILDLRMPGLDGFEVMAELRGRLDPDIYLPILVVTADHGADIRRRALDGGATDFLIKPFSPTELRLRVRNLLDTRSLHLEMEDRVRQRTRQLEEARLEILQRLARAAEYRDDATGEHTRRVARRAGEIARELGVDREEVEMIRAVAPLHDVGKIGIPDRILLQPGALDAEDFEVMKTHTSIGGKLLSGSGFTLLDRAAEVAETHHEWWDGTGYPRGLVGDAIPLAGRIVAVADTFDALTHARPYKPAWSRADAVAEIVSGRGRHFDPDVVDAFRTVVGAEATWPSGSVA